MLFEPKSVITETEIQKGLKNLVYDGITGQAMVTLTSGVFLVAFALKLGASNMVVGLLAAIPLFLQLVQIPSIYLIEKYRNRRRICVIAATISRSFWLLIALLPFWFSPGIVIPFLIVALLVSSAFSAITASSWNSWMRDFVPQEKLGFVFSKRLALATALSIPISMGAAFFLDYCNQKIFFDSFGGFALILGSGFGFGMLSVYFFAKIPEPKMNSANVQINFLQIVKQPFQNKNFKNLLIFFASWHFAVNLAAPFFTVYLLQRLEMDLLSIIGFTILSQLTSILFFRIWGKFSDRYSNKSVLQVSGPLFIICILAWTFTTLPEKHFLTIPLLILIHIFMGISTAGVALASGNIGLKLAPKGQATSYLASISLITSLAAGIAPIIGGQMVDLFVGSELSLTLKWMSPNHEWAIPTFSLSHWDFFFLFAFLLGTYSIHRLALVQEDGEVEEKIIIQELFSEVARPLRTLSTAHGLRHLVTFPVSLFRFSRLVAERSFRKNYL